MLNQFYAQYGLHMKLLINQVAPSKAKQYFSFDHLPKGVYQFCCERVVRRAQLGAHVDAHHGELLCSSIDSLAIVRCPNWHTAVACPYAFERMLPVDATTGERLSLGYNHILNEVTVRYAAGVNTTNIDHLSHLIDDVLFAIAGFLDDAALYCLSMVNWRLRDVCAQLALGGRGVVERRWAYDELTGGWVYGESLRSFSRCVDNRAVRWQQQSPGEFIEHVRECCHAPITGTSEHVDLWPKRDSGRVALPLSHQS